MTQIRYQEKEKRIMNAWLKVGILYYPFELMLFKNYQLLYFFFLIFLFFYTWLGYEILALILLLLYVNKICYNVSSQIVFCRMEKALIGGTIWVCFVFTLLDYTTHFLNFFFF